MKLKVAEICKKKGITLKELANRLGITNVGLSQQLNGNPTVSTLEKIADALEVHICDLFIASGRMPEVTGFLEYRKTIYKIEGVESLEKLMKKIQEKE